MEKFDLIRMRSFGDKLNEVTGLIYDHFTTFLSKGRWYLIALTLAIALIAEYVPHDTIVWQWFTVFLIEALLLVGIALFTSVCSRLFDGQDLPSLRFRSLMRSSRADMIRSMVNVALLAVVVSLVELWLYGLPDPDLEDEAWLIYFLGLSVLMLWLTLPLFYMIYISVFEHRGYLDAMHRLRRLLVCHPFKAALSFFVLLLLGLCIPSVMFIPRFVYGAIYSTTASDYVFGEDEGVWQSVFSLLTTWFNTIGFVAYVLFFSLCSLMEYGNAVEHVDNRSFMDKYENFENL